jgi:hypothetical protein
MKLNNEILPGIGIGGVTLGENIDDILDKYAYEYEIKKTSETSHSFDGGFLTIYNDEKKIITNISCNKNFSGAYAGVLWAGMTVSDVLQKSKSRIAWSGFVEVNGIRGIGLSLPNEFDDFEEITDYLDLNFIFEELWVYKINFNQPANRK